MKDFADQPQRPNDRGDNGNGHNSAHLRVIGKVHNPVNRVPLTRRCRHAKLFLEKVVGKAEHAILFPAAENERGAIPYSQNLEILNRRFKRQLRTAFWFSGEESDAQHHVGAGFDFLKRTFSENVFQLVDRLQDDGNVMTKRQQKFLFYLPGERNAIGLRSFKQHVAARYKGSDILESERFDDATQVFHLDQLFAADIDAAQECYVLGHLLSPYLTTGPSPPANLSRSPPVTHDLFRSCPRRAARCRPQSAALRHRWR